MVNRVTIASPLSQKLIVTATPKNRISINNQGGGGGSGVQTLVQLRDVDASDVDNNETVVYDAAKGKFVVEELPIINGGEF